MTPLLSTAVGFVIAALTGLLLLALAVATVLLVLLVLLVLDLLLQRNGIDGRAAAGRVWSRLRRPGHVRDAQTDGEHGADSDAARAPRVPFSARRPRPHRQGAETAPVIAAQAAPRGTEPVATVAPPATDAPARPASDAPTAVTQVLPAAGSTDAPPAKTSRTRTPRTAKPALRGPAAAASAPSRAETETPSGDRDSAIDRLFAPLLESDGAEETPRPRSTRRPGEEA